MSQKIPKSAATVSIASRLDHDIIIHLDELREEIETGQFGQKTVKAHHPIDSTRVIIYGKQRPRGEPPEGYTLPETINGCAITRGVDAETWEKWVKQVSTGPGIGDALKPSADGLPPRLSVYVDDASLRDGAKEHRTARSGLEPINPADDPRMPKQTDRNIGRITPDDRRSNPAS